VLHAQCTSALSSGFLVSQGNAEALGRLSGETKHHMISYFVSNTSAKNCCSQDYSKSKVGRFSETRCSTKVTRDRNYRKNAQLNQNSTHTRHPHNNSKMQMNSTIKSVLHKLKQDHYV